MFASHMSLILFLPAVWRCRERGLGGRLQGFLLQPWDLPREVKSFRVQGYAIEHGEYRRGLMGAAAPIREYDGKIKYALGIVGLFRSVMSDEFQSAIRLMLKIAEETM